MAEKSVFHCYDDGDDVVYVHAYRSVTNGWHLGMAIIASQQDHSIETRTVTCDAAQSFATFEEAAAAARRLARSRID